MVTYSQFLSGFLFRRLQYLPGKMKSWTTDVTKGRKKDTDSWVEVSKWQVNRHLGVAQRYVGRDAVNLCCIVLAADAMPSWLHGGRLSSVLSPCFHCIASRQQKLPQLLDWVPAICQVLQWDHYISSHQPWEVGIYSVFQKLKQTQKMKFLKSQEDFVVF